MKKETYRCDGCELDFLEEDMIPTGGSESQTTNIFKKGKIMAYISTEDVRTIRQNLKREFPEIKFSVRRRDGMAVDVSIMKSHYNLGEYRTVNHYHLNRGEHGGLFKRIMAIVNAKNWNNSDPQTDYFDIGYYSYLEIGQWDRPYVRDDSLEHRSWEYDTETGEEQQTIFKEVKPETNTGEFVGDLFSYDED